MRSSFPEALRFGDRSRRTVADHPNRQIEEWFQKLPGKTKTPRQRLCMMKRLYEIIGMLTISIATMLALLLLQLITAGH
jgi:hypothetical protein